MRRLFTLVLAIVTGVLLLSPCSSLCREGYENVVWIDARGHVVYEVEQGATVMKTFVRYREVVYDDTEKKSGFFLCKYDEIVTQIAIKDIKSIRGDTSPEGEKVRAQTGAYRRLLVTTRDGKQLLVTVSPDLGYALTNHHEVEFRYYSEATGQYELGGVRGVKIREIEFY